MRRRSSGKGLIAIALGIGLLIALFCPPVLIVVVGGIAIKVVGDLMLRC